MNCSFDTDTEDGAPVINENRDFLGMCIDCENLYIDAVNIRCIASQLEDYQRRPFQVIYISLCQLNNFG